MIFLEQIKNNCLNFITAWLGEGFWENHHDVPDKKTDKNDNNLSKEEQSLLNEINNLQKELEGVNAGKEINEKWYKYLHKKLTPDAYKDVDAKQTVELLELYKKRFLVAEKEGGNLQIQLDELKGNVSGLEDSFEFKQWVDIGENWIVEKNAFWMEELQSITSREFLKLPKDKRLQYITKNHIDSDKIAAWEIGKLEFTFQFDGKSNHELYLKTTAWQTLPEEVRSVSSEWVAYERTGINGEFYSKDTHKRLVIKEGTKIDVVQLATQDELQNIKDMVSKDSEVYAEPILEKIAKVALEKWIEPKMFILCVKNDMDIKKLDLWWYDKEDNQIMSQLLENDEYVSIKLEMYATEISMLLDWEKQVEKWEKYDIKLAAKIINVLNPSDFEWLLEQYWFKIEEISSVRDMKFNYSDEKFQLNREQLASVPGSITSRPIERSESGTTLCSKTAALNLKNLWLNVPREASAKTSFEKYKDTDIITNIPPTDNNIEVLDLFLDASPKNKKYWHRVACVKLEWLWCVLDPYYAMPGIWNTRSPIPLDMYMSVMKWKWREIWWAVWYEKKA
jgi:hypothetical protein